jgi:hypothetical protein
MSCISCGKSEAEYRFQALEVQTLHLREFNGERKIQALGNVLELDICEDCAMAHLSGILSPGRNLFRKILPFALLIPPGILLTILFRGREPVYLMPGICAILCGCLGGLSAIMNACRRRQEYAVLDQKEALAKAAWDAVSACAPKKVGDNDLTYIPVTRESLARKNGDLMILYDLIPDIAKEAFRRIHLQETLHSVHTVGKKNEQL